ncbi:MAG TPA: hypothetical protein PKK06_13340 [Phycisphaerae bacterium]|nr:hypothetical protein [Phycisphaerae bacterium]HNU45718.1 hypothetical protein [Phycisphaerae bacterium]
MVEAINWLLLTVGDAVQWLWHDGLAYLGAPFVWAGQAANPALAPVFTWLNAVCSPVARVLLAPVAVLPGWLSNTLLSAGVGVLLLVAFKYTSNQQAIGRVRDCIKANLLAIKLFKYDLRGMFKAQGRVIWSAAKLLRYSLFPLLVMLVPMLLLLGQMGLWYQHRPLAVGEETLVTLKLGGEPDAPLPAVEVTDVAGAVLTGPPVRATSLRELVFGIRATTPGYHQIIFDAGGQQVTKELAVGTGLMRVSAVRPGPGWTTMILHPAERPLAADCPVQSIRIDYPPRDSWTSGSDWWVAYFFVVSLLCALLCKPLLNVRI